MYFTKQAVQKNCRSLEKTADLYLLKYVRYPYLCTLLSLQSRQRSADFSAVQKNCRSLFTEIHRQRSADFSAVRKNCRSLFYLCTLLSLHSRQRSADFSAVRKNCRSLFTEIRQVSIFMYFTKSTQQVEIGRFFGSPKKLPITIY